MPREEVVEAVESLGVAVEGGGSTSAYADLGASVNLNAVAIGIGLENVVYEPERFPGVVYEPEAYDSTVAVVFGNGTLFVDSAGSAGVDEIVDDITAQLAELGLIPDPSTGREFSLTPTEIPVPAAYADATGSDADDGTGSAGDTGDDTGSAGDTGDDTGSAGDTDTCAECGHGLSGGENYCPECGAAVAPSCPSCGHDLAGGENFCPECGTDIAAD